MTRTAKIALALSLFAATVFTVGLANAAAGNDEIQLDLFLSYGSNPPLYPKWQEYFRKHQPPMLIAWGKND